MVTFPLSETGGALRYNSETEITIDGRRQSYAVRIIDWNRLRTEVEAIPTASVVFANAAWAGFGISASAFIAAICLPSSGTGISAWVPGALWSGAFASLVVGSLSLLMQRSHDGITNSNRERCVALLADIEAGFHVAFVDPGPIAERDRLVPPERGRQSEKLPDGKKAPATALAESGSNSHRQGLEDNILRSILSSEQDSRRK